MLKVNLNLPYQNRPCKSRRSYQLWTMGEFLPLGRFHELPTDQWALFFFFWPVWKWWAVVDEIDRCSKVNLLGTVSCLTQRSITESSSPNLAFSFRVAKRDDLLGSMVRKASTNWESKHLNIIGALNLGLLKELRFDWRSSWKGSSFIF